MFLETIDCVCTLLSCPSGDYKGERLIGWPRADKLVDKALTYCEAETAIVMLISEDRDSW